MIEVVSMISEDDEPMCRNLTCSVRASQLPAIEERPVAGVPTVAPPLHDPAALLLSSERNAEGREGKVGIVMDHTEVLLKNPAHLIRDRTEEGEEKPISGPDDFFNGTQRIIERFDKKKWTEQLQIGDFEAACRLEDERAHRLSVDFTRDPTGILTLLQRLLKDETGPPDADGAYVGLLIQGVPDSQLPDQPQYSVPHPIMERPVDQALLQSRAILAAVYECAAGDESSGSVGVGTLKDDCRRHPAGTGKEQLVEVPSALPICFADRRSSRNEEDAHPSVRHTTVAEFPVVHPHDGLQVTHGAADFSKQSCTAWC